jgi:hypothetical protein
MVHRGLLLLYDTRARCPPRRTGGLSERTIVVSDPGISSSHGNVRSEESSRLIRDDGELGLSWWMDGMSGVRWWLSAGHRRPVLAEWYDRRPRPTTTNDRLLTHDDDLRRTTCDYNYDYDDYLDTTTEQTGECLRAYRSTLFTRSRAMHESRYQPPPASSSGCSSPLEGCNGKSSERHTVLDFGR